MEDTAGNSLGTGRCGGCGKGIARQRRIRQEDSLAQGDAVLHKRPGIRFTQYVKYFYSVY